MSSNPYQITLNRGFLPNPDPLLTLEASGISGQAISELETIAAQMPTLIPDSPQHLRALLDELPVFAFSAMTDEHVLEHLFVLYTYFANAYIYAAPNEPRTHIPAGIAVPLVQVAGYLDRPPILSYAALVLHNWQRIDPDSEITVDNLQQLVSFQDLRDEHWFSLIHVNVEAAASGALLAILDAIHTAQIEDLTELELALGEITSGIRAMLKVFHRITEQCDPDVYHQRVRTYMFGLADVIFEGVSPEPQTLNGGSGAQSSTIPAFVGALGIQHEKTGLMNHLDSMQLHMPKAHRQFIGDVTTPIVRNVVIKHRHNSSLKDAYNDCVKQLLVFRRAHLHYAKVYIFDKVANPIGTGGTPFMDWLAQLLRETEAHLLL